MQWNVVLDTQLRLIDRMHRVARRARRGEGQLHCERPLAPHPFEDILLRGRAGAGTNAEALEAVKVAIEPGNDVNAVDKNAETAMHGAVSSRSWSEGRDLQP